MPDVADYRVISDTDITLRADGPLNHSFTFDLGTAVKHDQPAILQFFYKTFNNPANLLFRFSINGTEVRQVNVSGLQSGTIHEVQSGITKNNVNKLDIRIMGGIGGGVTISDIVIFVQRAV